MNDPIDPQEIPVEKKVFRAGHNFRADGIVVGNYIGIFAVLILMILFHVDANSAVGGAMLLTVGKFLSNWGTNNDYEFGASQPDKSGDAKAKQSVLPVEK